MTSTEQKKFDRLPPKYRERVAEVEDDRGEDNGWWIHLKDGWVCETSAAAHTIHEDTFSECIKCLRQTRPEVGRENF